MKKIVLIIAGCLLFTGGFCQSEKATEMLKSIEGKYSVDENGNVTIVRIISVDSSLNKDEIYNRAYAYFIYNYVSGESVIQMEDKARGVIVAKGLFFNVFRDDVKVLWTRVQRTLDLYHIIRMDIKENKLRIIITMTQYKSDFGVVSVANSYPFNDSAIPQKDKYDSKDFMIFSFVSSYKKCEKTIGDIESAVKFGNTSKQIENSNW